MVDEVSFLYFPILVVKFRFISGQSTHWFL